MLKNVWVFLKGKKTYIVAFLMIILSGLKAEGYITASMYNTIVGFLGGLGLITLRMAV